MPPVCYTSHTKQPVFFLQKTEKPRRQKPPGRELREIQAVSVNIWGSHVTTDGKTVHKVTTSTTMTMKGMTPR